MDRRDREIEYIEQIKAIAKDIPHINDCDCWHCNGCPYFEHYGLSKDTCKDFRTAQLLFGKGYRKADEVKKETAKIIFNEIEKFMCMHKDILISPKNFIELKKKFGIGIEND